MQEYSSTASENVQVIGHIPLHTFVSRESMLAKFQWACKEVQEAHTGHPFVQMKEMFQKNPKLFYEVSCCNDV